MKSTQKHFDEMMASMKPAKGDSPSLLAIKAALRKSGLEVLQGLEHEEKTPKAERQVRELRKLLFPN